MAKSRATTIDPKTEFEVQDSYEDGAGNWRKYIDYNELALAEIPTQRRYVDECMLAAHAADELGISRETMSTLVSKGLVQSFKLGDKVLLIPKDEVERLRGLPRRGPGRPAPEAAPELVAVGS